MEIQFNSCKFIAMLKNSKRWSCVQTYQINIKLFIIPDAFFIQFIWPTAFFVNNLTIWNGNIDCLSRFHYNTSPLKLVPLF